MNMKISKKNLTSIIISFLFIPIICLIYWFTITPQLNLFFFTNFLILFFSYIGSTIINYKKTYSLVKLSFIYLFFFFGFMPLFEISSNVLYWGNQQEPKYLTKVLANFIILVAIIFFYLGNVLKVNFFENTALKFPVSLRFRILPYFLILILFLSLYLYYNNYSVLLFRLNIFEDKNYKNIAEFIFYQNIVLSSIFILLIISYNHVIEFSKNTKVSTNLKIKIVFFAILLIAIIFCNPLSLSRFQVAVYYLPFLFYLKIFNKPFLFFLIFICSILFLMPLLDFFRYNEMNDIKNLVLFDLGHLKAGHFDGYQNFLIILENNINFKGTNLFTSIFWFIPRSIFETKSIGSGEIIADLYNLNFTNISVSFFAEGYLAFGLFGICAFALFAGIVTSNLDSIAWKFISKNKNTTFLYYYYFLFGQIFFLYRGDLLSGFAFLGSFAIIFIFVLLVFRIKQF